MPNFSLFARQSRQNKCDRRVSLHPGYGSRFKRYRCGYILIFIAAIAVSFLFTPLALTQEEDIAIPANPTPVAIPSDGLYFADVLVRNLPIFQIGSRPQIDASARADIINRRIASLLSQNETPDKVSRHYSRQSA